MDYIVVQAADVLIDFVAKKNSPPKCLQPFKPTKTFFILSKKYLVFIYLHFGDMYTMIIQSNAKPRITFQYLFIKNKKTKSQVTTERINIQLEGDKNKPKT